MFIASTREWTCDSLLDGLVPILYWPLQFLMYRGRGREGYHEDSAVKC